MSAYQIFTELSKGYGWWAHQTRKVRWLASRYYSGADSIEQLRALATERPVTNDFREPMTLSPKQVQMIIDLR